MKYAVTTAPTAEPISLADAKAHIRSITGDTTEDSAIITPLIQAAREYCENITGRALASQTVKAYPERFPHSRALALPRSPIISIAAVRYTDSLGVTREMDSQEYWLARNQEEIFFHTLPSAQLREHEPIEIEYICGYTTGNALPMAIRQAMLLLIGHWYVNREAVMTGATTSVEVDLTTRALLRQYKAWWF